jgi:trk system potassium uptake protein TrkA
MRGSGIPNFCRLLSLGALGKAWLMSQSMNVVIVGAGVVGRQLAAQISEDHRVAIIDHYNQTRGIEDLYDVQVVAGDATQMRVLSEVVNEDTDLLVAVTTTDAVNALVSLIGKRLGAKKCIARVRNTDAFENDGTRQRLQPAEMGIDRLIYPERLVTDRMHQLVLHPFSLQRFSFLRGGIEVLEVEISATALESSGGKLQKILGIPLTDVVDLAGADCRIVGLIRDNDARIPAKNDTLVSGDRIFLLAREQEMVRVLHKLGFPSKPAQRVFLCGGTNIGIELARRLQEHCPRVCIIDSNRQRTKEMAFELTRALVFHGEPTDTQLLKHEGIAGADVFVAVTEDEEDNLIACMLAHKLGCQRTIALTSRPEFMALDHQLGMPTQVSLRNITVNQIMRFVLRGQVMAVEELVEGKIEVLEYQVTERTLVRDVPLRSEDFRSAFPHGAFVAGIHRHGEWLVPEGNDYFVEGDEVMVVCPPRLMDEVDAFFNPSLT